MSKDHYWRAREAEVTITGTRFCTNCRMHQRVDGGLWKISNNGMNRRWKCRSCLETTKTRAAVGTAATSDATGLAIADTSTNPPAAK